jgi:plastocyanin
MNKKIIAVVILSITFGAGYYLYFRPIPISQDDKMKVEELILAPLTVVYTNEGYSPKEITVKKGETVKFINMSDRRVWTASDEHPAHTIYPEFDQKTAAGRGNEYTFKFDRVGTWGFHNHSNAKHLGTVTVTE